MLKTSPAFDLVDAVYLALILGNQPRSIDRFIDYFGGRAVGLAERGTGRRQTSSYQALVDRLRSKRG